MKTSELDYVLPPERIAQKSVQPRDTSKMMVFDRATGAVEHRQFCDIANFLRRGDLLVFNNTKVFRARLRGRVGEHAVEILLLRPHGDVWECLGKPGKRLRVGAKIIFSRTTAATVLERFENGSFIVQFFSGAKKMSHQQLMKFANAHGEIPLPPYVSSGPTKLSDYQTVYAKQVGSVAAPTAGFHFTRALRVRLKKMGVQFAEVTLHVGIGTFQPIKTEHVDDHQMHAEMVGVCASDAQKIAHAKKEGRRVIAVGTTTTRALEGAADAVLNGAAWYGDVDIFIHPGFQFRVVDALVTNFHLPKSTLMLLVSAMIGEPHGGLKKLKELYAVAIQQKYRFYSFGDALLVE
ncbi:MAG: tRNA preQ1(34) S-adenosylmethionine ribosyltransferase-isomerase QueA [Candidatus Magasanikbacteria bacterium RIFCSPHIGHO2_01_FULL_50_8]|uniref:S-adenosylmethionine:tRNA ribosyltransferase-isomerase n=2 Tax=Candidatus Magasanikiibacteriota TaxID=1752731 RepID=A0A1F6LNZ2_9BACT|nr:MAG: tRNA preQ1(34) S-adenosylmethionine ribosyltransferase-isomerase QueA [Candidatus Magasanikbacteria bacterium RIFCSPHIGHO2_01_FULL_50_8]OGH67891.1 MAG: tRNA preQ1(34) S-adenosylmethionine ribosyltransferase-isomerase QueA [Candidatus Magasanikbacteria bacterium RIFCSPHIGHO2_02_FULL_50_9b]